MKKDLKRNYPKRSNTGKLNKSEKDDPSKSRFRRKDNNKPKNNESYLKRQKDNSNKSLAFNSSRKDQRNVDLFNKKSNNDSSRIQEKNIDDLIWGKHAVYSILESGKPVNRIWCTSEIRSSEKFFLLLKEIKKMGTLIEEVQWSRISQITYGAVHQGIALQIAYSRTISLSQLISQVKKKYSRPLLVMTDGITDPHNLGAIIRSAEAFGCAGIIIPQRRSSGLTGTVAKVAAGALENIPVSRVINLNRTLEELKNEGFTVIGLTSESESNISVFNDKIPLVVVIGSEGKGLSVLTQ